MSEAVEVAGKFWGELPPATVVSLGEAEALARDYFGITGTAKSLGSNQETNLMIKADDGRRFVLKIANPGFGADVLELQNQAMTHVHAKGIGIEVPVPVPSINGDFLIRVDVGGAPHNVRMLTFVAGEMFSDAQHLGDTALAAFGAMSAHLGLALADFSHPADERALQYDSTHARQVVNLLASSVADPIERAKALAVSEAAWARLDPLLPLLRRQVIHADLADYNVVAVRDEDARLAPAGVIDFGDVVRSWLVADVATAIAALLVRTRRSPLLDAMAVVKGYHQVCPLTEAEVAAVWPLVNARAAVLAVSVDDIIAADPTNQYAVDERPEDWLILDRAASVPHELAEDALRQVTGHGPSPAALTAAAWTPECPVISVDPGSVVRLDLSTTSALLDGGVWADPLAARAAVADLVNTGLIAVGGHGEGRLALTEVDVADAGETVHLGLDAVLPVGTPVFAPASATVTSVVDGVVLACGDVDVALRHVHPVAVLGQHVAAGDIVATVHESSLNMPLPPSLHVQILVPGLANLGVAEPELGQAWLAVSPNPAALLGLLPEDSSVALTYSSQQLLDRRNAVLATVQEHYFAAPPRLERGWRQHMFDTTGRAYLDMVNNVAVLGHSHPAVAAAASRQYRLLNTNSRLSYAANVEFAERIVATLPAELDTVFLVSSGSEADDLALRIARTATGRKDTIALAGAYHGWTTAIDEISTTLNDNPHSRHTRPPWVHLAEMPNLYRGPFTGPDAAAGYADSVREILTRLVDSGGPAAFISEPLAGNQGGLDVPAGYLAQVYAAVRVAGGLCISDEVQIGYGRTGDVFWGFQWHNVVPDIVTMAKAAGNGHPLGFVVTRREIADAFASEGSFFSSVGGSPVSSVVGSAVLDTIAAEGLQANAALIGERLRGRLEELQTRHELIGHLHGRGLYQGIELVSDRDTKQPATRQAAAICERLRERGVLEHATGDHSNVLKVKPPLVITEASADFFIEQLDEVLSTGW